MALHIVSSSANHNNALKNCIEIFDINQDDLLLTSDATYALLSHNSILKPITKLGKAHALSEDLELRGIKISAHDDNKKIEVIDYPAFVQLTEKHKAVCSWY